MTADSSEIARLIDRLRVDARSEAEVSRMMAEAKSLRQADNEERRTDLYMWTEPEKATAWQAADMIESLAAKHRSTSTEEVERLRAALEPFARYADAILKRRDGAQDEPVAVERLVFGIDGQHVTIGDLRRARTALTGASNHDG